MAACRVYVSFLPFMLTETGWYANVPPAPFSEKSWNPVVPFND